MKRILCMLLASIILVSAMFAFASCENSDSDDKNNKEEKKDDAELILGTWETEIDLTKAMNDEFALDEEMAEYIKVKDFKFTMLATMNKDGTYEFVITEETANKAIDNLKKSMVSGFEAYFEDMAEEYDISVKDFLDVMGVSSVEEFVDFSFGEEFGDEFIKELSCEGKYKIKDGKFYTTDDGEDEIDKSKYETYKLSENEFKLIKAFGEDEEDSEIDEYLYPIIFKRVK